LSAVTIRRLQTEGLTGIPKHGWWQLPAAHSGGASPAVRRNAGDRSREGHIRAFVQEPWQFTGSEMREWWC
jgi:hypothetical protein